MPLRGEGLIELDQVEVADLQPKPLHQLAHRRHRTDAHHPRRHRAGRKAEHLSARLQAVLLHRLGRGEDHRGRAVVDAGRVARRHRARIAECRLQLGEPFKRRLGPRMLVLVDGHRSGLAAGHGDRNDLFGEIARRDRLAGALLRADRERVLVGARDLELLGDVLAGLAHGIDAVLRLHHRIDEAPADGGVVDLGRAREGFRRLAHHERRARHRTRRRRRCRNRSRRRGSRATRCRSHRGPRRRAGSRCWPEPNPGSPPAARPCARRCGCPRRPGWRSRTTPRRDRDQSTFGLRSFSAFSGTAPRSSVRIFASEPPKRPIGVRTASQIKTSRMVAAPPAPASFGRTVVVGNFGSMDRCPFFRNCAGQGQIAASRGFDGHFARTAMHLARECHHCERLRLAISAPELASLAASSSGTCPCVLSFSPCF